MGQLSPLAGKHCGNLRVVSDVQCPNGECYERLLLGVGAAALLAGPVLGQAPASRPSFEIASIQASTRPTPGMRGGALRGNRSEIRNAHMVDLIRTAYNVQQPDRITGGPSWLEWNRFDITALAPKARRRIGCGRC